jgi:hypothetical protein
LPNQFILYNKNKKLNKKPVSLPYPFNGDKGSRKKIISSYCPFKVLLPVTRASPVLVLLKVSSWLVRVDPRM